MPNLIFSIDPSQFYNPDITIYYDFIDCGVQIENELKLLKTEAEISNENSILFLLVDENEKHLSILRLVKITIRNSDYFQIRKSYSPIQNKGYGYLLYRLVINTFEGTIISDSYNTLPGSYNIWMKLLRNKQYTIQILNLESGIKNNIEKPINELKIWGVETDYLEEINKTEWDAVVFEDEFVPEDEDDYYDEEYEVNYLSENDKYERNMVSDFVVRALKKGKNKIKDRKNTVLLVNHSSQSSSQPH